LQAWRLCLISVISINALRTAQMRPGHPWQEQTMAQAAKPQSQSAQAAPQARPAPVTPQTAAQQTPDKNAVYTDFASI
jgi:hypothetical protein